MFRHVALFRWAEGTTGQQVQTIQDALGELPAVIPELLDYSTGADVRAREGTWDFAVVADFDDAEGWRTYVAHPAHQHVLVDLINPRVGERASVQYECRPPRPTAR